MRKNVAVFFGGRSCENEISVITGTMTANLLRGERYEVFPVYIAQNGCMYTGDLFDTATFKEADLSKKFDRASVADGKLYAVRGKKMRELCAFRRPRISRSPKGITESAAPWRCGAWKSGWVIP